jgi:hypothetical protein
MRDSRVLTRVMLVLGSFDICRSLVIKMLEKETEEKRAVASRLYTAAMRAT